MLAHIAPMYEMLKSLFVSVKGCACTFASIIFLMCVGLK